MGPLTGLRVIEMQAMGPVPFCGMLLADMGADVVRIDRAGGGDDTGPTIPKRDLRARGKRAVALDLKRPEHREDLFRLIERADLLIEGFRPGVMERMGIGPADCHARQPRLVYGRATGYGQDGPMAQTAGHDINYIALSGALAMIGPAGGAPVPPLNLVGDYGGGALYLAFGVMCALHEAKASGKGQVVDAAMIDGTASLLTVFHGFLQSGELNLQRGANRLDGGAPYYAAYETKDGQYVAVGAIEARFYRVLLERLGLDKMSLPAQDDHMRWPELRAMFAARFRERTRDEWEKHFDGHEACFSPVLSLEETAHHPHNVARGALLTTAGLRQPAPAPRLSRTPGHVRGGPPDGVLPFDAILAEWATAPGKAQS